MGESLGTKVKIIPKNENKGKVEIGIIPKKIWNVYMIYWRKG